jgi:hypothetical protein
MDTPFEVLDQLSDQSLEEGLTKNQWLDYLIELRDELDMKIRAVENEENP